MPAEVAFFCDRYRHPSQKIAILQKKAVQKIKNSLYYFKINSFGVKTKWKNASFQAIN